MAVVAVFDEDALIVEPDELTPNDRKAISLAIAEHRKHHDTARMARAALQWMQKYNHGPKESPSRV